MIVTKNQWHYKVIDMFGTKSAKDKFHLGCQTTCSYIRALVWSLIMATVTVLFFTFIGSMALTFLVSAIVAPFQLLMGVEFVKGTWSALFYFFGGAVWFLGGIAFLCALLSFAARKYQERQPSAQEKANLIKAAYQDKVNGICTLVTLEK